MGQIHPWGFGSGFLATVEISGVWALTFRILVCVVIRVSLNGVNAVLR